MNRPLLAATISATFVSPAFATHWNFELQQLGSYASGKFAVGAAEIVSYDPITRRAFVVNAADTTVEVLDIRNPSSPVKFDTIDASALGGSANSVDVQGGIVAVAIEAEVKTDPGRVAFYRSWDLKLLKTVAVGALPDMITFTPDGRYALVANEGEPNSYNQPDSVDPEGSISIIDLRRGVSHATVQHATFTSFNSQAAALRSAGVRIYGPNATVAQDLEPEYIAVDGSKAYVTLQEANAIAVIDIPSATVSAIRPLGYKDHSVDGFGLDASDRDGVDSDGDGTREGAIHVVNWPVRGLYQPDSIASYRVGGRAYLVTANEGDTRAYTGFNEEVRMRAGTASADFGAMRDNDQLGRLTLTNQDGNTDTDASLEVLYVPGARSFSIWDAQSGARVFDSGNDFEAITGNLIPAGFNANNDANNFPLPDEPGYDPDDDRTFDTRSDNKGPEPEGLAVGQYLGRTFAFVGLERTGGVMVYDITDPIAPEFMQYLNNRDFAVSPTDPLDDSRSNPAAGDLGPEGLHFVPWYLSPTLRPLLLVGNEISGTTTVYQIKLTSKP